MLIVRQGGLWGLPVPVGTSPHTTCWAEQNLREPRFGSRSVYDVGMRTSPESQGELAAPMLPPAPIVGDHITYLELAVPWAFADAVTRHHANLRDLAETLSECGLPPVTVQLKIDELVASYRDALLQSIPSPKAAAS